MSTEIEAIKEAVSIAEIIGERIKLTPAGNYQKGLCPFHHEKSPSFFVNDALGFYKCFGCGETGDVLDFLQKYESLTFREALEMLAQRAGITLSNKTFDKDEALRQRLLELMEEATLYYQDNLAKNPACQAVREYLEKRKTFPSTVKLFRLGAAEADWQSLCDHLSKKKFSRAEIIASGMGIENNSGRLFDRFRGRLMFPLKNHRGKIVGFSGRMIAGDEKKEAKYMNTPETLIYHKGKMLYGLHELGQEIKKQKEMLIVEGEFDMLSSYQAGVDYVCAIKGSALTDDHAKLISRYVKKVILALDADRAGVEATKKAIAHLRPEGVELRVVMIDQGKDPDEFAKADPAGWRAKIETAVSVYDFFLTVILASHDQKTIDGQKNIVQELASIFALIDSQLEYEFYLKKLATILEQDKEILRQDLLRFKVFGEKIITQPKKILSSEKEKARKPTKMAKIEAYIWFLFLQCLSEKKYLKVTSDYILETSWENHFLQQLAQYYQAYKENTEEETIKGFLNSIPADFAQKVKALGMNQNFVKFLIKNDLWTEWQKATSAYKEMSRINQSQILQKELLELDKIDDLTSEQEKRQKEILQKLREINSK